MSNQVTDMDYEELKRIAIDTIDDLTDDKINEGYGKTYNAATRLDDIRLTAPVRAVMTPLFNKNFRARYGQYWEPVRSIDTVKCQTIGDVIRLAAAQAQEAVPGGEPA